MEIEQADKPLASNVYGIFFPGSYWRMASIAVRSICIVSCILQPGFCGEKVNPFKAKQVATELFIKVDDCHAENILETFNTFDHSKDPFADGKKFLNTFLREIHSRYGLNLTVKEACQLVYENLHTLGLTTEMQQVVLNTIELYASNNPTHTQYQQLECSAMIATGIGWPWEWAWNWRKLLRKESTLSIKAMQSECIQSPRSSKYETEDIELPSDIYIGGAELLEGALCLIVGTVIPVFYAAGGALITDGGTRIVNGVSQMGEQRRNDPNYVKPNFGR